MLKTWIRAPRIPLKDEDSSQNSSSWGQFKMVAPMTLMMLNSIVFNYLQSTIMQSEIIILFCDLDDSILFSLLKRVIYTFIRSALFL